ncbi:hypothetical protein [Photobacterium sanguinicancri]|uniref:hypothetical protein n=1 Tax=Photobacterium sanguinicancri TaxID=875932 RepID=UPI003D0D62E5
MNLPELTPKELLLAEGIAVRSQALQSEIMVQESEPSQPLQLITTAGAKALSRIEDDHTAGIVMDCLIEALASANVTIIVRNQLALENKQISEELQQTKHELEQANELIDMTKPKPDENNQDGDENGIVPDRFEEVEA